MDKGRALPFTKPVFTQASIEHKVEYNILPKAHLSMHVLAVCTLTKWKQQKQNLPTWKLWVSSEGHLVLGRPLYA